MGEFDQLAAVFAEQVEAILGMTIAQVKDDLIDGGEFGLLDLKSSMTFLWTGCSLLKSPKQPGGILDERKQRMWSFPRFAEFSL